MHLNQTRDLNFSLTPMGKLTKLGEEIEEEKDLVEHAI